MNFSEKMRARAKTNPRTLVLPEGTDTRILQAARIIADKKLASHVTLLGDKEKINVMARENKIELSSLTLLDPANDDKKAQFAAEYYALRKHKGMSKEQAEQEIVHPLKFAAMMVRLNIADAMVGGAAHSTADMLRAAITIIKTNPGTKVASSCFVMCLPDKHWGADGHLIFSDCATVPNPDAEQLSEITISAAESCRAFLNIEPVIAMLSFSSYGSAQHQLVDKVKKALQLVKQKKPDLNVDGEMQVDSALIPSVAEIKVPGSKVGGRANVLIFPDLNAGNIGYKLVQRFCGAKAYGPLLQGFTKPVNDLSRGCSIDDIVNTAAVTLVQAQQK
ncbi:MAG: phosphate acetyltransferase [Spirochaetales bacterium]|nr:phosphate acetyltransferase [Spirochaetales bacterium]